MGESQPATEGKTCRPAWGMKHRSTSPTSSATRHRSPETCSASATTGNRRTTMQLCSCAPVLGMYPSSAALDSGRQPHRRYRPGFGWGFSVPGRSTRGSRTHRHSRQGTTAPRKLPLAAAPQGKRGCSTTRGGQRKARHTEGGEGRTTPTTCRAASPSVQLLPSPAVALQLRCPAPPSSTPPSALPPSVSHRRPVARLIRAHARGRGWGCLVAFGD